MPPLEITALLPSSELGLLAAMACLVLGEVAGAALRPLGRGWLVAARSLVLAVVVLLAAPSTALLAMVLLSVVAVLDRRHAPEVDVLRWMFRALSAVTRMVVAVGVLDARPTAGTADHLSAELVGMAMVAVAAGAAAGATVAVLGSPGGFAVASRRVRATLTWVLPAAVLGASTALAGLALADGAAWRALLLLPGVAVVVATAQRLRRVEVERTRLDAVSRLAAEVGAANTVADTMRRLIRFAADEVGATRAELVFFIPGNRSVHATSLVDGHITIPEEPHPEGLRRLVEDWQRADLMVRDLGVEDAHPMRRWLAEAGIGQAVIAPLAQPEAHGLLVVGHGPDRREDGAAGRCFDTDDAELLRLLSGHGLEALLRARRDELLATVHRSVPSEERPALFDWLTGLPNAAMLARHLDELDEQGELAGMAVLAVGLEGLGELAERHGAGVVDQVTTEVARRLLNGVRGTDFVATTGEGSFVVVVRDLPDMRPLRSVAERLARQIQRPVVHRGAVVTCGSRTGVAAWDGHAPAVTVLGWAHESLDAACAPDSPSIVEHPVAVHAGVGAEAEGRRDRSGG